jgi:hypothetical protein
MDEEEINMDIINVRTIIKDCKRRLHTIQQKQAKQGIDTNPDTIIAIEDAKVEIRNHERKYEILTRIKACYYDIQRHQKIVSGTLANMQPYSDRGDIKNEQFIYLVLLFDKQSQDLLQLGHAMETLLTQYRQMP